MIILISNVSGLNQRSVFLALAFDFLKVAVSIVNGFRKRKRFIIFLKDCLQIHDLILIDDTNNHLFGILTKATNTI